MTSSSVRTLNVLVEDSPGVLNRVSGMIRRRGFNIEEVSVGPAEEAGLSRMTLTVDAGHAEVDQVRKQLSKLIEVIDVADLTDEPTVIRELLVARVEVSGVGRQTLIKDLERRGGRIVDAGPSGIIVELATTPEQAEAFIEILKTHELKELARSGPVAMRRQTSE